MKRKIDREAYLIHARSFNKQESRLVREFQEWLPDEIIDCHVHCNLAKHVRSIDERLFNQVVSSFPSFSLDESKDWHKLLHPNKTIRSLRFPMPFRGIDHQAANIYLLEQSDVDDRVALYGLPDDPEYTIEMLAHPRASALKMYYSYLEPPATKIYQYFPKVVLEVAQERDIPIVLHPPLKITMCLDQIIRMAQDFPRLRVCLAHFGFTLSVGPGLKEAFASITAFLQIPFDTSLVPSAEVVAMALKIIGPDRIMYGSDEPFDLIRGVLYLHPYKGERLATEYPYHWVDPADYQTYKHLASGVTHLHWQAPRAIKTAVSVFPQARQELIKQKLFYANAKAFYGF